MYSPVRAVNLITTILPFSEILLNQTTDPDVCTLPVTLCHSSIKFHRDEVDSVCGVQDGRREKSTAISIEIRVH